MEKAKQILAALVDQLPNRPQPLQAICALLKIQFNISKTQLSELKKQINKKLLDILEKEYKKSGLIGGIPLFDERMKELSQESNLKRLILLCNQRILAERSCFCLRKKLDPIINCPTLGCRNVVHSSCIPGSHYNAFYECPSCALQKLDPLKPISWRLSDIFNADTQAQHEFVIDKKLMDILANYPLCSVEIRCIQVGASPVQQTWPIQGELYLNGKKIKDFIPLPKISPLKKRKDLPMEIQNIEADLRIGSNYVGVTSKRSLTNGKQGDTYMFGVFVVEKIDGKTFINEVKKENRMTREESQNYIIQYFQDFPVEVTKVVVPLTCPFDFQLIQTPVRGIHCRHLQCFSLENFVAIWERSQEQQWTCPLCHKKAVDLKVDPHFEEIITNLRRLSRPEVMEVQISQDTSYQFIFAQKNNDVIVLEEEPIVTGNYLFTINTEPPFGHQYLHPQSADIEVISIHSSQQTQVSHGQNPQTFPMLGFTINQSQDQQNTPNFETKQSSSQSIQFFPNEQPSYTPNNMVIKDLYGDSLVNFSNCTFSNADFLGNDLILCKPRQENYCLSQKTESTIIEEE